MTLVRDPNSPGYHDHAVDALRYACIDFGYPIPRPWYVRVWCWIKDIPRRLVASLINWRFSKFPESSARPFGKAYDYQRQMFAYLVEAEKRGHKVIFMTPVRIRPTPMATEDWFYQQFIKQHEDKEWKPIFFEPKATNGMLEELNKYKWKPKADTTRLHIEEFAYAPSEDDEE